MTILRSTKKSLNDLRKYFQDITDEDANWALPSVDKFLYPIHDELELILLGAEAFVAYPIHQCSGILGHFKISVNVSFILRIEMRDLGTKSNERRLKEILQH